MLRKYPSGIAIDEMRPSLLNIARAFQANDISQVMKFIDTLFVNIPSTLWIGDNTFSLLNILMESERNYVRHLA